MGTLSRMESVSARLEHANTEVTSAINAYRMALLQGQPTGALELRCSRALHAQLAAFTQSQELTKAMPSLSAAQAEMVSRVDASHSRVQDRRAGGTIALFGRGR